MDFADSRSTRLQLAATVRQPSPLASLSELQLRPRRLPPAVLEEGCSASQQRRRLRRQQLEEASSLVLDRPATTRRVVAHLQRSSLRRAVSASAGSEPSQLQRLRRLVSLPTRFRRAYIDLLTFLLLICLSKRHQVDCLETSGLAIRPTTLSNSRTSLLSALATRASSCKLRSLDPPDLYFDWTEPPLPLQHRR